MIRHHDYWIPPSSQPDAKHEGDPLWGIALGLLLSLPLWILLACGYLWLVGRW